MAGTLQVENLIGPTTGANTNKVVIPAGQTLDASAGTLVPSAGHVIHVEQQKGNNTFTSSGSVWVDSGVYFDYTPKSTTSLIVCQVQVNVWRSPSGAYFGVRVINSGGNTGLKLLGEMVIIALGVYHGILIINLVIFPELHHK